MTECPLKNYAECTAQAVSRALASRPSPRPKDFVGACKGTHRLNKKAFLSMVGAKKYTPTTSPSFSLARERLEGLRVALSNNGGDVVSAARSLGIPPSTFRARYNYLLSQESMNSVKGDATSPTPERKFTKSWQSHGR